MLLFLIYIIFLKWKVEKKKILIKPYKFSLCLINTLFKLIKNFNN